MTRPVARLLLALAVAAPAAGAAPPLVFIAPANHGMPFVEVRGEQLTRGLLKDLGEAIAARLGREARFVVMPARRVSAAMAHGEADGLCYTNPHWIDARQLHWSRPMFDYAGVVARRADAPPVQTLKDLAGERLGTVASYRYAEVEAELGPGFLRDDAPDMTLNLAKLAAGRTRYALTESLTLAYASSRLAGPPLAAAVVTTRYPTYCAFSEQRGLPLADVDRAIDELMSSGSMNRLLARYR